MASLPLTTNSIPSNTNLVFQKIDSPTFTNIGLSSINFQPISFPTNETPFILGMVKLDWISSSGKRSYTSPNPIVYNTQYPYSPLGRQLHNVPEYYSGSLAAKVVNQFLFLANHYLNEVCANPSQYFIG
jgi:hypothetical protein